MNLDECTREHVIIAWYIWISYVTLYFDRERPFDRLLFKFESISLIDLLHHSIYQFSRFVYRFNADQLLYVIVWLCAGGGGRLQRRVRHGGRRETQVVSLTHDEDYGEDGVAGVDG